MSQINSLSDLLPNQQVLTFPYSGGIQSFTVPYGYSSTMDVYLWGGAGGGGGSDAQPGGNGAGGQFAYSQITANAGDIVSISVGAGGGKGFSGGGASGGTGGASIESITSKTFTGGQGGNSGPNPYSGSGGGGGGATVVAVNGTPIVVAGGGGGGGGGGCFSPGGNAPGATNPPGASVYPAPLWGTYPYFLSANGIWGPDNYSASFDGSWSVNFPVSGVYTWQGTADNAFTYYIDGAAVFSGSDWGTVYTASPYINAGSHTVTMHGVNYGGPASAALVITAPDGSVVFDSINPPSQTQIYEPAQLGQSHPSDGGGGAGGGGGWPGGNGGASGNGDNGGGWGYSGTSYGAIVANDASGQTPGNAQSPFYNGSAVGGSVYGNGGNGYAVIVVTFKGIAHIKEGGVWKPLVGSFNKVNGEWKLITGTWIKENNEWKAVAGSTVTVSLPNPSNFGSDQTPNRSYATPSSYVYSSGDGQGGGNGQDGGQDSGSSDGGSGGGGGDGGGGD